MYLLCPSVLFIGELLSYTFNLDHEGPKCPFDSLWAGLMKEGQELQFRVAKRPLWIKVMGKVKVPKRKPFIVATPRSSDAFWSNKISPDHATLLLLHFFSSFLSQTKSRVYHKKICLKCFVFISFIISSVFKINNVLTFLRIGGMSVV